MAQFQNSTNNRQDNINKQQVAHEYALRAQLDDNTVAMYVTDNITNKKWKIIYTEHDYDINLEYKKMKHAIDSGNIACKYPQFQNDNLTVVRLVEQGDNHQYSLPAEDD
eukprot:479631_1